MKTIIQMELLELVKAMRQFQDDTLPKGCDLHIDLSGGTATVAIHGCPDHHVGLEVKRLIGAGDANKATFDPHSPWHVLQGPLAENVNFNIFCRGLPPMCRVETYEEEIPKTDIVTLAEKVKVKRTRICCGEQVRAQ